MSGFATDVLLGLGSGAIICWLGYRGGLLSWSGGVAVLVVCVFTFLLGGWVWGVLPVLSFIGSIAWSRYRAGYKSGLSDRFAAGAKQGWQQILGRTGWAMALVALHRLVGDQKDVYIAFVGALATASADLWSTEVGVLSPHPPRLITTGRRVLAGTPGGISVLGMVASFGGAWLIGLTGLLTNAIVAWVDNAAPDRALLWLPLAAMLGGTVGSLADSLLGAAAQGIYFCEQCGQRTERAIHRCGGRAAPIRGWPWLTNEGVNFVSSVVGAAVTAGTVAWFAQASLWW